MFFPKLSEEDKKFVRAEIAMMFKDISIGEIGGRVVSEVLFESLKSRIILCVLKIRTVMPFEQIDNSLVGFMADGSHVFPNLYTDILLMKLKLAYPL